MKIVLKKWTMEDATSLSEICNKVDRKFLSNRIPFPYTIDNANWWLNMAKDNEGKKGIFRAIIVDGKYVGNIDKINSNCLKKTFRPCMYQGKGIFYDE